MIKCIKCHKTDEQVSFDEYLSTDYDYDNYDDYMMEEELESYPICDSCINSEERERAIEERERAIEKEDRKFAEQGMKEAFGIDGDNDANWGDYLEMNGYT